MNDEWFWRWLLLRLAESYFTWFWERYGRSWRDDSDAAIIKLYIWCYVAVLQLIQSFEIPEHQEEPVVLRDDRAELEGLRESFQRQLPTYDPFAAALGRVQLNSIRQVQKMLKSLQIEQYSVARAQKMLKSLQIEQYSVAQVQKMLKDMHLDSIRGLDRYRNL